MSTKLFKLFIFFVLIIKSVNCGNCCGTPQVIEDNECDNDYDNNYYGEESEEEDELELQEEIENEQDNQPFVPLEEFVINQGILDPSEPASPLFSTNEHTSEDTTSTE
uniref:Uncharacterized protein n=1 Tax=Meloidogyne enterolobii TaxID=390850 RepID=A0A6V7WE61_MELEN|nr:unnamed protein product [Meloidogyne enterolobii]